MISQLWLQFGFILVDLQQDSALALAAQGFDLGADRGPTWLTAFLQAVRYNTLFYLIESVYNF